MSAARTSRTGSLLPQGERSTGLTFSCTEAEAVTLHRLAGGRWEIESYRKVALRPGDVAPDGQILKPEALHEAVRELLPGPLAGGQDLYVAFEGAQVLVRLSRVKAADPAALDEQMLQEVRRYPRFGAAQLRLGFRELGEQPADDGNLGPTDHEVLILAAREDAIAALQDLLQEQGTKADLITSRILAALGVVARADERPDVAYGPWAAVSIVYEKLVISLWMGRKLQLYRELAMLQEVSRKPLLASSLASRAGPGSAPLQDAVRVDELIVELKRSLAFQHVADPAAVVVYLVDVADAEALQQAIASREPGLDVRPYRLDELPSLDLKGHSPSVAAVGAAMLGTASDTAMDLSLPAVRRRPVGPPVGSHWLVGAGIVAALLLIAGAFLIEAAFLAPRTREFQVQKRQILADLQRIEGLVRGLEAQFPGGEKRDAIRVTWGTNQQASRALAGLLARDLRAAMQPGIWINDFTYGPGGKFNLTGGTTAARIAMDLSQTLARLSYLRQVNLLATEWVPRQSAYRFRIVGLLAPPPASTSK